MDEIEVPTTELFITGIVATTECDKHNAPKEIPCYRLESTEHVGFEYWGVCPGRARKKYRP